VNIATGWSPDPPAGTPPPGTEHRGASGDCPEQKGGYKGTESIQWYWKPAGVLGVYPPRPLPALPTILRAPDLFTGIGGE